MKRNEIFSAAALLFVNLLFANLLFAEVVVYSDGFETDDGGYTHTGTLDQWQWGMPDLTFTPGPKTAHSGSKCWGTSFSAHIPSNSDSYLTSQAIAVPSLGANEIARVRFFAWIALDEMYDRGEFQVSSDKINWSTEGEFFHRMLEQWTEYNFDISAYAGKNIYLRWRCRADSSNSFSQTSYNMAGFYVDDVAITIAQPPQSLTKLTLKASEDQSAYASCPWIYTWDGESYVRDNDIYSTSRGKEKEAVDYYRINQPLVPKDGRYSIMLRETENEKSFTDMVQLIVVDHKSNVKIAPDENGKIWAYSDPVKPLAAVSNVRDNAAYALAAKDELGYCVYNGDYIDLDFGDINVKKAATFVIRVLGFQIDPQGQGNPTFARPTIFIQTQNAQGEWVTRHFLYPRMDWTTSAFDLRKTFTINKKVRITAASCHDGKYHIIDFVGLDTRKNSSIKAYKLSPVAANHCVSGDVLNMIRKADNVHINMSASQEIELLFPVPKLAKSRERDFIFVSKGYYEPMGTFFIYTWDGNKWAQRDGWSIEGYGFQTHNFNLSLWLPDPDGDWKVRIWQDYWYEPAAIDYVGITRDGTPAAMVSAFDLRKNQNVTSLLNTSDDYGDEWSTGDSGYPSSRMRNRWVEVIWSPFDVNIPPTTNPVTITNQTSPNPTINWTYNDQENDPQVQYEVQVWTGSAGTGNNIWNPPIAGGSASSVIYNGQSLVEGETYYARVKTFDGYSWGTWSEASWTYSSEEEPNEIEASLMLAPHALSRSSYQQTFAGLVKIQNVSNDQIDTSTLFVLYPGGLNAKVYNITVLTDLSRPAQIFMLFNKNELMDAVPANGDVELTVTGKLKSGQEFSASDIMTISD